MKHLPSRTELREYLMESLRPSWRIGIVYSSFYKEEMTTMRTGAVQTLKDLGVDASHISEYPVSGSFEIPLIGSKLAKTKAVDALIGLGIIIEGETHHARLVAEQCVRGMMDVQLTYHIPFTYEVLYADSMDIIHERLHKGEDAALTTLHSLAQLKELQS